MRRNHCATCDRSIVPPGGWCSSPARRAPITCKMSQLTTTHAVGQRELARRAEALSRHLDDSTTRRATASNELAYLRAQLAVVSSITARLAAINEVQRMADLVAEELHKTFAFYLVAIQRADADGMLRLLSGRGELAEVMTEFLLLEQPIDEGVNGRVARSASTALVYDTRVDPDYIVRDPETDPRSELSVPILSDGQLWGVVNIEAVAPGAFGEADAVLVEAIASALGTAVHRSRLLGELEQAFTTTLSVLTSTVEAKDDYTAAHGSDVAELAERVALEMGLSSSEARQVRYAAILHDVGKIVVPNEILCKPGPLTDDERNIMRNHAAAGGQLVGRIEAFAHLAAAVRASHERWDGDGYPDRLAGQQIPLAARIIAACDTFDAIVTDRPYRRARTVEQARVELDRVAGSQLDEHVVEALARVLEQRA